MIGVLDRGYIELVEAWGSDEHIIAAARMSTNKGFQGWGPLHEATCKLGLSGPCNVHAGCCAGQPGDEKLLAYLWRNGHTSPFEMCGATFEVKAPIFVFREWHRHRTQSYNEMSARYTPLPDENYLPDVDRLMISGGTNKQAGSVQEPCTPAQAEWFRSELAFMYEGTERLYQTALIYGIPKELARVILPVGRYSRMRASANLLNWTKFLKLRLAPNAQWEIRQYAQAVQKILNGIFPRTMELFARDAQ